VRAPLIAGAGAALLAFLLVFSSSVPAAQIGEITEFGEGLQGSPPGTQSHPRAIAAGPDGNLWFTDEGPSGGEPMVGRITPGGAIAEWALPATSRPDSITAGPDGNIWFTDFEGAIGRIHPVGTYSEIGASLVEFDTPGIQANSITAGPDGNVWFTAPYPVRVIGRIASDGTVTTWSLPEDSKPMSIAAGPDGRLWYTDDSRAKMGRIDPAGTDAEIGASLVEFEPGKEPLFITAGPAGKLWFTHNGEGGIGSMSITGAVVDEFETPVESLDSIAAGPDGNVWFTDFGTTDHAINRMTPSGVITRYSQGLQGEGAQSYPVSITPGPTGTSGSSIGLCRRREHDRPDRRRRRSCRTSPHPPQVRHRSRHGDEQAGRRQVRDDLPHGRGDLLRGRQGHPHGHPEHRRRLHLHRLERLRRRQRRRQVRSDDERSQVGHGAVRRMNTRERLP
jgi:streptogramin lyase